jgi:hypothetical protein
MMRNLFRETVFERAVVQEQQDKRVVVRTLTCPVELR